MGRLVRQTILYGGDGNDVLYGGLAMMCWKETPITMCCMAVLGMTTSMAAPATIIVYGQAGDDILTDIDHFGFNGREGGQRYGWMVVTAPIICRASRATTHSSAVLGTTR